MNSILRKTLIAAAVTGAVTANAATVSSWDRDTTTAGIQQVISSQGLALRDAHIVVGNRLETSAEELQVEVTPGFQNYTTNDELVFTFTGAQVDTAASPLSGVSVVNAAGTAVATGFGYLDDDAGLRVVVTDATAAGLINATGAVLYLEGVTLDNVTGPITVEYNGQRGQSEFDQGTAVTVATVATQFSVTQAQDLDATIDVENERETFVDTDSTNSFFNANDTDEDGEDTWTVAVTNTSNLLTATISEIDHSVTTTGNFDWTLDSDSAFDTTTVDTTATIGTATESLSTDGTTLSINVDGDVTTTTTHTVTFDVPGDVTLVESEFTLSSTVDYYLGSTSTNEEAESIASGVDIGDWGLSGATRFIEFYPLGTGLTQFVYVANTSDVDAEIELTVYDDSGTVYECGEIGVSAAGDAVTSINGAIRSTLDTCNVTGNRLALSLTINAPDANIDLTAGYNSRGDRVLID